MVSVVVQSPLWAVAVRHRRQERVELGVAHRAHEIVAEHDHFRGRADCFTFTQRGDVLYVTGRVPTYYLKQVLQTALQELDGVSRIENRVDVVCSNGLSSVRGEV
jgi:hypothetical protein